MTIFVAVYLLDTGCDNGLEQLNFKLSSWPWKQHLDKKTRLKQSPTCLVFNFEQLCPHFGQSVWFGSFDNIS